jgi:hypothetical protein
MVPRLSVGLLALMFDRYSISHENGRVEVSSANGSLCENPKFAPICGRTGEKQVPTTRLNF